MEICELDGHPYFVASQFHPESPQSFTDSSNNDLTVVVPEGSNVNTKQYVAPVAATGAVYGPDPNADPLWDKVEVLLQGGTHDVSKNAYPLTPPIQFLLHDPVK